MRGRLWIPLDNIYNSVDGVQKGVLFVGLCLASKSLVEAYPTMDYDKESARDLRPSAV